MKALKSLAISTLQDTSSSTFSVHGTGIPSRQKETAHSLKSDVYARVRALLRHVFNIPYQFTWPITRRHNRSTSGIRNAEMKWTNHGNLSVYGVRLEGWPTSIPMQNPSTLSTNQNRELRDALASGTLKFCRINSETSTPSDATSTSYGPAGNSSDLSWAISEEFNTPVRCFLRMYRILVSDTAWISNPQVSHIADIDRVTYREEPTDYFPGVKDSSPSKSISAVRERIYPVSSFGPSGPLSMGEAEMLPLEGAQSNNKRQRLDDG